MQLSKTLTTLLLAVLLLVACGSNGGSAPGPVPAETIDEVEAQLHRALDDIDTDSDFSLLVEAANGRQFVHNRGDFDPGRQFESASTSKWVTAAVVMDLVNLGLLSLDDHPQDYISFWPSSGNLSEITLRHLLSFTSGLSERPLCIDLAAADFVSCVQRIAQRNAGAPTPGSEFFYGPSHMQVAGLMAIIASGADSWAQVFADFQAVHGLFANGVYDLPSLTHPRLAGGMHHSGEEYLVFLADMYHYELFDQALIDLMSSDQIGAAQVVYSPAEEGLAENWRYGLGNWIECDSEGCTGAQRYSSPGAYGAYPFIDRQHGYFGILARQGSLGSYPEGYAVFVAVRELLEQWAALNH